MLIGVAASAHGQQPATPDKRALIKELLDVTDARKSAEAMMNAMLSQVERMSPDLISDAISKREDLTPKQREELRQKMSERNARVAKRYKELFAQRVNLGQVMEDISLDLYGKYFTESELQDMIAFYKSPTGRKTIELIPRLLDDSMTKAAEVLLPRIRQLAKEVMDEEQKHAENSSPAPPPPNRKK
jgi:hypothetical protein